MTENSTNFTDADAVEIRILAWVMGEASAAEAAELARMCEENLALKELRREMAAMHGLLVSEAEMATSDAEWKISAARRKTIEALPTPGGKGKSGLHSRLVGWLAMAAVLLLFAGIIFQRRSPDEQIAVEDVARAPSSPISTLPFPAPPSPAPAIVSEPAPSAPEEELAMAETARADAAEIAAADNPVRARRQLETMAKTKPVAEVPTISERGDFPLQPSGASFEVAAAALQNGVVPDRKSIQVSDFYNAIDYGDPGPVAGEVVAITTSRIAHPVFPGKILLRVAWKFREENGVPENASLRVDFLPARVAESGMTGFRGGAENGIFRNEKVENSGRAGIAMFIIRPKSDGKGDLARVTVEFARIGETGRARRVWEIPWEARVSPLEEAAPGTQLSALALLAGEKLAGGTDAGKIDFRRWATMRKNLAGTFVTNPEAMRMLKLIDALE